MPHRFKLPWCAERITGGFVFKDANGQAGMEAVMEWVMIYFTLIKSVPVLTAGGDNYKTKEECIEDNYSASDDTFWCVPRNWLDDDQRDPVRAFVTD